MTEERFAASQHIRDVIFDVCDVN